MITTNAVTVVGLMLLVVSSSPAQQEAVPPAIDLPLRVEMLGDALEMWSHRSSGQSISVSTVNGVTTIDASEEGVRTQIVEDPQSGLQVTITRQFGRDNEEQLMEKHPSLYMHWKSFPVDDGDAKVELTIGITRTYEAATADELRAKFPEAFDLYEKYSQMGEIEGQIDRLTPLIRAPQLEFRFPAPLRRGLIVPAEGEQEKQDDGEAKQEKQEDGGQRQTSPPQDNPPPREKKGDGS